MGTTRFFIPQGAIQCRCCCPTISRLCPKYTGYASGLATKSCLPDIAHFSRTFAIPVNHFGVIAIITAWPQLSSLFTYPGMLAKHGIPDFIGIFHVNWHLRIQGIAHQGSKLPHIIIIGFMRHIEPGWLIGLVSQLDHDLNGDTTGSKIARIRWLRTICPTL